MNAAPPRVLTTPALLAGWCVALRGIDGITVSGGDPFDQPPSDLAEFLESIRERSKLSILVFTGRTLDQLRRHPDPAVARCLSAIDILVDGPYVEELNDGVGWRGSSNQVIHALGPRSSGSCEGAIAPRRVELMVTAGGRVSFTGIPTRGRGEGIAARLQPATGAESTKKADTETIT
jgi:anaerobic ribonucleoside-triphosphate reductase activating protein